nr:MAG TPA: hypothetical protein [Caudoviricetes sp.]
MPRRRGLHPRSGPRAQLPLRAGARPGHGRGTAGEVPERCSSRRAAPRSRGARGEASAGAPSDRCLYICAHGRACARPMARPRERARDLGPSVGAPRREPASAAAVGCVRCIQAVGADRWQTGSYREAPPSCNTNACTSTSTRCLAGPFVHRIRERDAVHS